MSAWKWRPERGSTSPLSPRGQSGAPLYFAYTEMSIGEELVLVTIKTSLVGCPFHNGDFVAAANWMATGDRPLGRANASARKTRQRAGSQTLVGSFIR